MGGTAASTMLATPHHALVMSPRIDCVSGRAETSVECERCRLSFALKPNQAKTENVVSSLLPLAREGFRRGPVFSIQRRGDAAGTETDGGWGSDPSAQVVDAR